LGSFLGSYLRTKGKNLATKEDVKGITNEIESVKSEYAVKMETLTHEHSLLREQLQKRHELSLAALDKRLAIQQEAYRLWWELMSIASKKDLVGDKVIECQNWYVKNALYLTAEVKDAFVRAYIAASIHPDILADNGSNAEEKRENYNKIQQLGSTIVEAVSLPNWGENEYQPLDKKE